MCPSGSGVKRLASDVFGLVFDSVVRSTSETGTHAYQKLALHLSVGLDLPAFCLFAGRTVTGAWDISITKKAPNSSPIYYTGYMTTFSSVRCHSDTKFRVQVALSPALPFSDPWYRKSYFRGGKQVAQS